LKNKALPLHGHFAFKMVHVDSQTKPTSTKKTLLWNVQERTFWQIKHLSLYEHPRRPSTRETLTIFDLGSSELEKLSSLKIRRDFLDAVLYFGRKPAWLKIFRKWKIKLCLCLDV
jgi:hypothetical protein